MPSEPRLRDLSHDAELADLASSLPSGASSPAMTSSVHAGATSSSSLSGSLSTLATTATERTASAKSSTTTGRRPYAFSTQCATVENPDPAHQDKWNASSVPIYQTATFKGGPGGSYDYTRSGNPTRSFLEHHIAKISGSRHAFVLTSGMGALDTILRMIHPGDEIIAGNDLYGGSNRLLTFLRTEGGVTVHHIDTTDVSQFERYLDSPNVKMVLLETPTNPLLQICDLEAISALVHSRAPDCVVVVDNTMMTSYLQRPLELGADVVYDSATKYLSGHHDLMAGAVICDRDDIAKKLAFTINSVGNGLSPIDSFLLLRGIKTLALRMDRQQETAKRVADYLHQLGFRVLFPSLGDHVGHATHSKQANGPGAVLSFITEDASLSERIVGATRLWGISVSFGCVNSLISMPCLMSHASIDPAVRKARKLPEDLIRLCVGIEDADDLIDDLESALLEAGAIRLAEDGRPQRVVATATEHGHGGDSSSPPNELVTSAPGKVILFGEHAVVHGVTAIAGSIDLRCYCLATPRADDKVGVVFTDCGLDVEWPLDQVPHAPTTDGNVDDRPDEALLAKCAALRGNDGSPGARAATAFLYLFARLSTSQRRSQTFTVRSALPIGAGLGSSGAFSVCIASALLYTHGHRQLPRRGDDDDRLVNAWAFVAEKINHGTPSGVDNSVSTFGGALAFRKAASPTERPSLEPLSGFESLRVLLTDSTVPRDTSRLVAHVGKRKADEPEVIEPILAAIQRISDSARSALLDGRISRAEQLKTLETLMVENHAHLAALGVSHPSLEAIRVKAAGAGLSTKLTGAGGGGCAVSLVPDSFADDKLDRLIADMHSDGFKTYSVRVGGAGWGLLVPPASEQPNDTISSRRRLADIDTAKLSAWASDMPGEWSYAA